MEIPDSQPCSAAGDRSISDILQDAQVPLPVRRPEELLEFFPEDSQMDDERRDSTDSQYDHGHQKKQPSTASRNIPPGPGQSTRASQPEADMWQIQGYLYRAMRGTEEVFNLTFTRRSQCTCSSCPEHQVPSSTTSEEQDDSQGQYPNLIPCQGPI